MIDRICWANLKICNRYFCDFTALNANKEPTNAPPISKVKVNGIGVELYLDMIWMSMNIPRNISPTAKDSTMPNAIKILRPFLFSEFFTMSQSIYGSV